MTGVEFVTTAPPVDDSSETHDAPPLSGDGARSRWDREELELTLSGASGHIRFLLNELAQANEVAAQDLKSKPVAYAQVQRICNSRGKDALVLSRSANGDKWYGLNPAYRSDVASIVAGATAPPPTEPRPKAERRPRGMRRANMSALDGIADSRGTVLSGPAPTAIPTRRIAQAQSGRSIAIPPEIPIDFCKELMGFINATASGTRYRIILEDDGYRLEAC